MNEEDTIAYNFRRYVRATFDCEPAELPPDQHMAVKTAFYQGAQIGWLLGLGATEEEFEYIQRELKEYGENVVQEHRDLGLIP